MKGKAADNKPMVKEEKPGIYYWCSCGKSSNQPFCNGSHKGSEFAPVRVEIKESCTSAWCMCKQTNTPPFCDGSHKKL